MQGTGMIAVSAAALGVAATSLVLTLRENGRPVAPRRFLAVNALLAALVALPIVIAFAPETYPVYMAAMLPTLLALPPALYAYVQELTGSDRALTWRHAILPLAGCLVALGYWALTGDARQTLFVLGEMPIGRLPTFLALASLALLAIWTPVSLGYLVLILKRLSTFRAELRDVYSNVEGRELRWIEWLMVLFVALWASAAFALLRDNLGLSLPFPSEWVVALAGCLLLFLATTAPFSAPASEPLAEPDDAKPTNVEKYARSALSDEHAERLAERIEVAMTTQQLFLDPNLSLQKLSRHVAAAPNAVSQTLNERLGSTFFDYVARWRVEAAKPLILADQATTLTIAMDVGFNSKSTFYKAFRNSTGMTPSDWKRMQEESSRSVQGR